MYCCGLDDCDCWMFGEYDDADYELYETPVPAAWNYAVYGSPLKYI